MLAEGLFCKVLFEELTREMQVSFEDSDGQGQVARIGGAMVCRGQGRGS
jgi:hypothetical protein